MLLTLISMVSLIFWAIRNIVREVGSSDTFKNLMNSKDEE